MGLREWRVSSGLTQRELANLAVISRSGVSNVEQGLYPPSAGFAGKVCRALSKALGQRVNTWDIWPDEFQPLEIKRTRLTVMQKEPDEQEFEHGAEPEYGSRLGKVKSIF
jgi:transcriptional regulator with XRE-family HTH domain